MLNFSERGLLFTVVFCALFQLPYVDGLHYMKILKHLTLHADTLFIYAVTLKLYANISHYMLLL